MTVEDHIANIRYLLNACVTQADEVHSQTKDLDIETIQLNIKDLEDQMKVATAELADLKEILEKELWQDESDTDGSL